ncbi:MAG TPA: hypothetical protein VJS92_03060 [Candidatus Polarisedimenticolaceae bacterium]|nr:hypothetical protein [Candidatus Polarisedimenticolaceae bacterium]
MELTDLLRVRAGEILDEAVAALRRAHLPHYEAAGGEVTRRRLAALLALTAESVTHRQAAEVVEFAKKLARERHAAGFDLSELQVAFNVLEESIWNRIFAELAPSELARALGLVSTVLGLGKDALARTYVELAGAGAAPSLDLRAAFGGTDGV